jgi:16S rRNA (cytosine967-C5)-methyltransferase
MKTNNPRLLAVKTLSKISNGAYSNLQLNQVIESSHVAEQDIPLLTNIVYGVIQHRLTLEYQLNAFLKKSQKLDDWVRELLYSAIYQMEYLDRIPQRAIFDESIKIAKYLGHDGIRRLVTGVLHQIARVGLPNFDDISDEVESFSVKYSISSWIITELIQQVGKEKTISILKSINQPSKQSVRYNSRLITKEKLIDKLKAQGYGVENSSLAASGLILSNKVAAKSPLFKMGMMTIQDESAMLPAESMVIKPNDVILDACSAPGGKTTQIAEQLDAQQGGHVYALDLHKNRLKQVNKNAARLKVSDVLSSTVCDARKLDNLYPDNYFDKILIDAPCSGIGLIRRKPEIRYEKTLADVEKLSGIQFDILESAAEKVKSGGMIVYSTCTILNQENSNVISRFLQQHDEFKLVAPVVRGEAKISDGYVRIYPDDFNSDGFFVCNLVKNGGE